MANRWQHCVQFDRAEIWTSDIPITDNALPLDKLAVQKKKTYQNM